MRAGGAWQLDLYLAEWKRSSATRAATTSNEAAAEAARIEARYTDADSSGWSARKASTNRRSA
jgi:hypothetical protein